MKKAIFIATMIAASICMRSDAVVLSSTDVIASVPTSFSFAEECNNQKILVLVKPEQVYVWGENNIIETTELTVGYYIVQNDDETMKSIADKLQLTDEYLMSVNEDYMGELTDKLARFALVEIPDADWRHLTEVYCLTSSGNYLEQISKYFYTSVEDILELNPSIKDENLIYTGYCIRVH